MIFKHPIFIGIALIIGSFITARILFTLEGEIVIWLIILTFGLFIAGLVVLKGWWKNNISNFNSQHNIHQNKNRYKGRF